jgi:hypothetical protein
MFRLEWWPEDEQSQLCEVCQQIKTKPTVRLYSHPSVAVKQEIWLHEDCLLKAYRMAKGRWHKDPASECGVIVR